MSMDGAQLFTGWMLFLPPNWGIAQNILYLWNINYILVTSHMFTIRYNHM